ncbi:MAG: DUF1330 domain-containing protein [Pseudomonadales bacterium]
MSAFIIAKVDIHDRTKYATYESGFMQIFAQYSGRLLAVDENPQLLEGQWPYTRTVVIEFPSNEEAMAWYGSDEYQALAKHRTAASTASIVLINGLAPPLER